MDGKGQGLRTEGKCVSMDDWGRGMPEAKAVIFLFLLPL